MANLEEAIGQIQRLNLQMCAVGPFCLLMATATE